MIPSIGGRIQTRILLFVLIGIPVTALYAWILSLGGLRFGPTFWLLLLFLATINLLGLILDRIYIAIQGLRWDRDWPFAYQLAFTVAEFAVVLWAASAGLIPWLPAEAFDDGPDRFRAFLHFLSVLVPSFLALLGPLQVLFIRWRFNAGRFGRF